MKVSYTEAPSPTATDLLEFLAEVTEGRQVTGDIFVENVEPVSNDAILAVLSDGNRFSIKVNRD